MAKEKAPVASAAPAEDRKRAIEAAMGQIEKMYGKGSIMRLGDQNNLQVDVIPTGSLSLDVALGGFSFLRGLNDSFHIAANSFCGSKVPGNQTPSFSISSDEISCNFSFLTLTTRKNSLTASSGILVD